MMSTHLIIILLALLQTACILAMSQKLPNIKYTSGDQLKNIGNYVQLQCAAESLNGEILRWMKVMDNKKSVILTEGRLIKDPRFMLHIAAESPYSPNNLTVFTLQINNFQKQDEGTYQCVLILSPKKKITSEMKLQMKTPPNILAVSFPNTTVLGANLTFECNATGLPIPEIHWSREGGLRMPSGSKLEGNKLKIFGLEKKDGGIYYCAAQNGVGLVKKSIDLQVQFLPEVHARNPHLSVELNGTEELMCHVKSNPPSSVTWKRNGEELFADRHHTLLFYLVGRDFVTMTLHVMFIQEEHFGKYICEAKNYLGSSSAEITLSKKQLILT